MRAAFVLADAEEIFVSEDVYSAEGVHALLTSRDVVSSVFKLKGVQQDLRVFRITKDLGQRFRGSNHIRRPRQAAGPSVDDGMAIDVVDAGHDALLQFVL